MHREGRGRGARGGWRQGCTGRAEAGVSGEGGGRGARGGRRQECTGRVETGVHREGEQKETGGKTESNG